MDEIKLGEQLGKLIESNETLVKRFDKFEETLDVTIDSKLDKKIMRIVKKAFIYALPSGGVVGIIAWVLRAFNI